MIYFFTLFYMVVVSKLTKYVKYFIEACQLHNSYAKIHSLKSIEQWLLS